MWNFASSYAANAFRTIEHNKMVAETLKNKKYEDEDGNIVEDVDTLKEADLAEIEKAEAQIAEDEVMLEKYNEAKQKIHDKYFKK